MSRWSPFDPDADRRLVRGLNEGDEGTLTALYDSYAERLYDYCMSLVCDTKASADIVHDCLIDAFRRAPRMRDRVQLRPWLYGAARRRCLQRGRSGGLHWTWTDPADTEPAEPALSVDEQRELVEATLARLDFVEQEALLLVLRHDLTGSDLAVTLGLSGRRAASRVSRARSRAAVAAGLELHALSRRCADDKRLSTRALEAAEAGLELASRTGGESAEDDAPERPRESRGTDGSAEETPPGAPKLDEPPGPLGSDDPPEPPETSDPPSPREPLVEAAAKSAAAKSAAKSAGAKPVVHTPDCPACLRRDEITITELLNLAPAPPPPTALRRRVVHTATDPELAAYRADIAGRGGNLTAQGMPRQPDVPSPFTRRWLFAGGGVAGALITAIVAVLIIGPDLPGPDIYWPSGPRHEPSISPLPPPRSSPPLAAPRTPRPPTVGPQTDGRLKTPRPRPGTTAPVLQPGRLGVGPTDIKLESGDRVAYVNLMASRGPVTWNAVPSTSQLSISREQGTIPMGGATRLTIVLQRDLVELDGQATITVTNAGNRPQTITVSWAGSVLT